MILMQLTTTIQENRNNSLVHIRDKAMLGERAYIETVNNELKNSCHTDNSRQQGFYNFMANEAFNPGG